MSVLTWRVLDKHSYRCGTLARPPKARLGGLSRPALGWRCRNGWITMAGQLLSLTNIKRVAWTAGFCVSCLYLCLWSLCLFLCQACVCDSPKPWLPCLFCLSLIGSTKVLRFGPASVLVSIKLPLVVLMLVKLNWCSVLQTELDQLLLFTFYPPCDFIAVIHVWYFLSALIVVLMLWYINSGFVSLFVRV